MPQAIVLSERKCPPSRSVSAPIASAASPVMTSASSNPTHGDKPSVTVAQAVA